jgi:hypothetical protein
VVHGTACFPNVVIRVSGERPPRAPILLWFRDQGSPARPVPIPIPARPLITNTTNENHEAASNVGAIGALPSMTNHRRTPFPWT